MSYKDILITICKKCVDTYNWGGKEYPKWVSVKIAFTPSTFKGKEVYVLKIFVNGNTVYTYCNVSLDYSLDKDKDNALEMACEGAIAAIVTRGFIYMFNNNQSENSRPVHQDLFVFGGDADSIDTIKNTPESDFIL